MLTYIKTKFFFNHSECDTPRKSYWSVLSFALFVDSQLLVRRRIPLNEDYNCQCPLCFNMLQERRSGWKVTMTSRKRCALTLLFFFSLNEIQIW